jgi:hypothetical protein
VWFGHEFRDGGGDFSLLAGVEMLRWQPESFQRRSSTCGFAEVIMAYFLEPSKYCSPSHPYQAEKDDC